MSTLHSTSHLNESQIRGVSVLLTLKLCRANTLSLSIVFIAIYSTSTLQNKGNPTALLMSGLMMLRHLELKSHADKIEKAVLETLKVFGYSNNSIEIRFCRQYQSQIPLFFILALEN